MLEKQRILEVGIGGGEWGKDAIDVQGIYVPKEDRIYLIDFGCFRFDY